MAECSLNGLKTLCEKEKLLVTSNCSFSHSVFKRLVLQTRENQGLFGKGLRTKLNFCNLVLSFLKTSMFLDKGTGSLIWLLTLSQTSVSAVQVFWKHCRERKNCSSRAISPFPTVFSTLFENFLPFSASLKLSSANSFSLKESKICRLGPCFYVSSVQLSVLKTLLEKDKLLIIINFPFSHIVFCPIELCAIYINFKSIVCKLFKYGRV